MQVGTFFGTAIGNSKYRGVRVRDVLRAAGLSEEDAPQYRYVWTKAYDEDPIAGEAYEGRSPLCWLLLAPTTLCPFQNQKAPNQDRCTIFQPQIVLT